MSYAFSVTVQLTPPLVDLANPLKSPVNGEPDTGAVQIRFTEPPGPTLMSTPCE